MYRNILILTTVLMISAPAAWPQDWQYATATASSVTGDVNESAFRPLGSAVKPAELLPGGEGWIWLRAEMTRPDDSPGLVFEAPFLAWEAWWNQTPIGESGNPPVYWSPSTLRPVRVDIGSRTDSGILLVKMFVRRGYDGLPAAAWSTDARILTDIPYLLADIRYFLSFAGAVLGFAVFFGGLTAGGLRPWKTILALFGLFAFLAFLEVPLAWIPGIARLFPWSVVGIASRAAIPFMLVFWRRSVTNPDHRDPFLFSLIELLLAVVTAFWLSLPLLSADLVRVLSSGNALYMLTSVSSFVLSTDPLPWFAVWCIAWALILWMVGTAGGRRKRAGTLLLLLVPLTAPIVSLLLYGADLSMTVQAFARSGMALALAVSLPAAWSLESADRGTAAAAGARDGEEAEEVEELEDIMSLEPLETLESLDALESAEDSAGPLSAAETAVPDEKDRRSRELLLRSLRSTMYPDSLPWDSRWALASARQGRNHPATGFHDVYGHSGGLSGFAFMDAGSDSLEAMYFAHMVRSELSRLFPDGGPLPGIARRVHRKSVAAAGAAGRIMRGVIGRFTPEGISFLPMDLPPMLLRRPDGRIALLPPVSAGGVNPGMGSRNFGEDGLKTMQVKVGEGDVLLISTPSLVLAPSPSGRNWGMAGLAGALRDAGSGRPEDIVSDIIGSLKDFCGRDELEEPLQVLVLKRR